MKKIIATTNAPAAIGPYSQAIDCGSFLVTSGQVPFDPKTGEFVPGGIQEQTRQVFRNIKAIVEAAGLTMDNVVIAHTAHLTGWRLETPIIKWNRSMRSAYSGSICTGPILDSVMV